eukprot:403942-Pelagomonas_calceolata.AAC.4
MQAEFQTGTSARSPNCGSSTLCALHVFAGLQEYHLSLPPVSISPSDFSFDESCMSVEDLREIMYVTLTDVQCTISAVLSDQFMPVLHPSPCLPMCWLRTMPSIFFQSELRGGVVIRSLHHVAPSPILMWGVFTAYMVHRNLTVASPLAGSCATWTCCACLSKTCHMLSESGWEKSMNKSGPTPGVPGNQANIFGEECDLSVRERFCIPHQRQCAWRPTRSSVGMFSKGNQFPFRSHLCHGASLPISIVQTTSSRQRGPLASLMMAIVGGRFLRRNSFSSMHTVISFKDIHGADL